MLTLADLSPVEKARVFTIAAQTCEALGKLHSEGLIDNDRAYTLAALRAYIVAPDARFNPSQKRFIEQFNQIVEEGIKKVEQSDQFLTAPEFRKTVAEKTGQLINEFPESKAWVETKSKELKESRGGRALSALGQLTKQKLGEGVDALQQRFPETNEFVKNSVRQLDEARQTMGIYVAQHFIGSDVEKLEKKYPECAHLSPLSEAHLQFIDSGEIMQILREGEEKRQREKMDSKALGAHFMAIAQQIRQLIDSNK